VKATVIIKQRFQQVDVVGVFLNPFEARTEMDKLKAKYSDGTTFKLKTMQIGEIKEDE
jgi:hypothetical protein